MSAASRRAVLTGIGVLTPLGSEPDTFWRSLIEGRSGIKPITTFDPAGLPVRFAGEISNFDPKAILDKAQRRSLKVMARTIQLAVAAAQLALNDSKVDKSKLDPDALRRGVRRGSDRHGAARFGRRRPSCATVSRASSISTSGAPSGCRSSSRCGCSSICPTCWPATCPFCMTPRDRTTASPKKTWPVSWRWARRFAFSSATRPISSSSAVPRARSTPSA